MLSVKNIFRILINTAIGLLLVFFWLKLVDINEVIEGIKKVNLFSVLPFFLCFMLANFFRCLRMKYLLKEYKVPLKNVIFITYLAQLLSFTIPIRIGEVAKGIYFSTEYGINLGKAVVWVFMDRFIDFWLILVMALILLFFVPTNLPANILPTLLISLLAVSLISSLVIFFPKIAKSLLTFFSNFLVLAVLKKYFNKITSFLIDAATFLNQGKKGTSLIILFSILALLADVLGWYICFLAVFGGVDILKIFIGTIFSMLTYLIPAAPGYVGSAEASGLAVFSLGLGFDKTLTSVVTVINHALNLIAILALGLSSLYFLKFDLNLVWKKFKKNP